MIGPLLVSLSFFSTLKTCDVVPPSSVRIYFVGNSVTDAVNYEALAQLAESRGVRWQWGRHMIPGAPLSYLWKHQTSGFTQHPFGASQRALGEFAWDAVTVQPFDRHLDGDEGDVPQILTMSRLAHKKNPDVTFFVYARWPRMTKGGKGIDFDKNAYDPDGDRSEIDLSQVDGYQARWNAPYTGSWDGTNETRDYFRRVLQALRVAEPKAAKQFRLIPVGDVFAALDQQMMAGKVPGYRSIYELYKDAIHLGRLGSYIVGCTFFATITGQSAVGLPSAPYRVDDPAIVPIIQRTVDDVVAAQRREDSR